VTTIPKNVPKPPVTFSWVLVIFVCLYLWICVAIKRPKRILSKIWNHHTVYAIVSHRFPLINAMSIVKYQNSNIANSASTQPNGDTLSKHMFLKFDTIIFFAIDTFEAINSCL